jgi:hypothetical protein
MIEPDPRHAAMPERFVPENPAVGDFLTDAVPAALAAGQGAAPALTDGDVSRFSISVQLVKPVKGAPGMKPAEQSGLASRRPAVTCLPGGAQGARRCGGFGTLVNGTQDGAS